MYHHWVVHQFIGNCLIPLHPWKNQRREKQLYNQINQHKNLSLKNGSYYVSCATLKVRVGRMPWPQTVTTHYQ